MRPTGSRPTAALRTLILAALAAPALAAFAPTAPAAAQEPTAAQFRAADQAAARVPRSHPFQQGVRYRIEAREDDGTSVLTGRARLVYTNHAPDALERLYFHQYLNAFRPNSAWATYDLRFNDSTFQRLGPDEYGFERLTGFTIDGRPVHAIYPGSPDSTVFYVQLPEPLQPGDSLVAMIDWQARLATEPRRQGRRGRHYDWAHWYPRIAVYGPGGWEYRPHIRPGELNGNFGSFDITFDLPEDQVMGATGVPVAGDPGWAAVAVPASEPPLYLRDAYGPTPADPLGLLTGDAAAGRKRVRWRAEKVHNFAWSTSPDYVFRGGRWEGKPIHLLWEPSSARWDPDRTMEREKQALSWLKELFGEYAWPQITVTDRIEGGATEFPMMFMTSGGAVIHESMHMVAHGILANNEWRQGWLDEGMASFLTSWLAVEQGADPRQVWGRTQQGIEQLDAAGESEPVGIPGADFSSYRMYSIMTYGKGSLVLRMLRDLLGEETFRAAMRAYYDRFEFHQVTEADFRNVMEAVSGRDLGWFFQEWLHTTDTLDYSVGDVTLTGSPGDYTLTAAILRRGQAWMPVTVEAGGQRQQLDGHDRTQTVTFHLEDRPATVVVDPDRTLLDTDRANNSRPVPAPASGTGGSPAGA